MSAGGGGGGGGGGEGGGEEEEEEEREGFEEWDTDFLDQLIQVEELALSCSSSSINANPPPPPPPQSFASLSLPSTAVLTFSCPPAATSRWVCQRPHHSDRVSHSPPRELSQRVVHSNAGFDAAAVTSLASHPDSKDVEIDGLKEHECFELRKYKRRKEEQIKSEERVWCVNCVRNSEYGPWAVDTHGIARQSRNGKGLDDQNGFQNDTGTMSASLSKTIGVQVGKADDSSEIDDGLFSGLGLSEKLLGIWGCTSDPVLGRNLISKLVMVCPTDFHVLFGCMNMNMSSKIPMGSVAGDSSSHIFLRCHMSYLHTVEATKVFDLHSLLTKIGNGLLPLEALIAPLVDLCNLENVPVVCCSMHILHVFLKHLFSLRRRLELRDNARVEGLLSGKSTNARGMSSASKEVAFSAGWGCLANTSLDPQHLFKEEFMNADFAMSLSCMDWVYVFQSMLQIAVKNTEEYLRLEALSIMNAVLMRSNAFTEREKFGGAVVFEGIAQLLKKDAGSHVQKKTLHMLYLLLNCPKLLGIFCSGCKASEGDDAVNDVRNASSFKEFSFILDGLANCLSCCGNCFQDIELRKRAVNFLAFLASSGRSGFEILVGHNLTGAPNFIVLILNVLVSEIDAEVSVPVEPAERIKARTLLIREALILLNRLVSNPGYSSTVLCILTAARDIASLTIDIATRLSQDDHRPGPLDSITWKIREIEIPNLARVFKKRVWSYLGDKIS